jgi:hypothetical protein
MDDHVLEVIAGAHSSGATGLLGRPDAERVLTALREAGYVVIKPFRGASVFEAAGISREQAIAMGLATVETSPAQAPSIEQIAASGG